MKRFFATVILLLCFVSTVQAHSGRTDSNGGHRDSSTGEYHYHHGYSAHQHTNGVCPFDFDDRTGSFAGTPGTGTTSFALVPASSTTALTNSETPQPNSNNRLGSYIAVFAVTFVVATALEHARSSDDYKTKYSNLESRLSQTLLENRKLSSDISTLKNDLEAEKKQSAKLRQQLASCQNSLFNMRVKEQKEKSAEAAKDTTPFEWYPYDYTEEQIKNLRKQSPSPGNRSEEEWASILNGPIPPRK